MSLAAALYQYTTLFIPDDSQNPDLTALNALGGQGWSISGIVPVTNPSTGFLVFLNRVQPTITL